MADTSASRGASPFSGGVLAAILATSFLGFIAMVALSAWSPELQSRDRAGMHPYSTSALGYQGLYRLLEAAGTPVIVSRSSNRLTEDYSTFKIVTLSPFGMGAALQDTDIADPALIILPKYSGWRQDLRPEWFEHTEMLDVAQVQSVLRNFDSDARLRRLRTPASIQTDFGVYRPVLGDDMQVMKADSLVSIVSVPGGDLVAQIPGSDIYILSDPDLVNTAGLAEAGNARMALALLNHLRWDAQPIAFDATLHGFERSENVLQMIFDVPFIGATLIALISFAMIGWAGAVRFGSPVREARAFALGKEALTDNTAGLIAMARRETRLAPGYLSLIRRATAKAVGAPRSLTEAELTALFDRLGDDDDTRFSTLEAELSQPAASREDLMHKARRLWRWHKEITHGHK